VRRYRLLIVVSFLGLIAIGCEKRVEEPGPAEPRSISHTVDA
jgi:hypothetical protein